MTREEAIARARKWNLGSLDEEDTTALYELIPELRESEDERIRKLLVWQVHRNIEDETNDLAGSVYDGIKGHDPDLEESIEDWKKCLTWLEKQKDVESKYAGMVVVSQEEWDTAIADAFKHGMDEGEKQKEHLTPEEKMNHPLYLEGFDIGKRVGEVTGKPKEWSEEDEVYLQDALWCVKQASKVARGENDMGACWSAERWLKSLRPQPQQNMSIGFMLYLDEHRPDGKMCLSNAECNEIETAFKNQSWDTILRYAEKYQPHWKPSEEQMEAFKQSIEWDDDIADVFDKTLQSLYSDLKKLM